MLRKDGVSYYRLNILPYKVYNKVTGCLFVAKDKGHGKIYNYFERV